MSMPSYAILTAPVLKLAFPYAAVGVVGVVKATGEIGAKVAVQAAVAKEMRRQA